MLQLREMMFGAADGLAMRAESPYSAINSDIGSNQSQPETLFPAAMSPT